ncbi:MAG: NAD-dependent epimerase/dehydratase family protein [Candidatus Thermoplasmatota archaeon]|nr:NAD-dependent epimerase/dehydratase family protein [Candidatus Thermoplasmatota archaeon]
MTRILITGALGQIGTEISTLLTEKYGKKNVVISDMREPSGGNSSEYFRKLDVTDVSAIENVVREEEITEIFHLAAILSATGERNPELAYEVNSIGTFNILKVSRKAGIEKVIIPSSIAAYGPSTPKRNTPIIAVTRPESIYGITKVDNELLSSYYRRKFGLDVRGIRFPGLLSYKTLPTAGTTDYAVDMIMKASLGENYTCYLSPDRTLPMMYMPDALEALMKLHSAEGSRLRFTTEYNISAFSFSPKELENELKRINEWFRVSYSPDYRDEIASGWPESLDCSDAVRDWDFRPKFSLHEMVDDMSRNFRLLHAKQ